MADDVTLPGAGTTFATDEINGRHFPRNKIAFGADGDALDVTSDNRFPVSVDETASLAKQDEVKASISALGSASSWFDITPDGNTDLAQIPVAISCEGEAGNVVLKGADGVNATFYFAKGQTRPLAATRVLQTGTTATGLVGQLV